MNQMTDKEKQRIIDFLSEKKANRPCIRCNRNNFTLLDGYFKHSLEPIASSPLSTGASSFVPSVVIICNNCGFIGQYALGVLEITPEKESQHE